MDLFLLILSVLGLAGSVACIVAGAYFLKNPKKRPHIVLKLPPLPKINEEKPENFLQIVEKATEGLEAKQD